MQIDKTNNLSELFYEQYLKQNKENKLLNKNYKELSNLDKLTIRNKLKKGMMERNICDF